MNTNHHSIVQGLTAFNTLVFALILSGCSEQQAASPPSMPPSTPVRVAQAIKQPIRQSVTLVGTVEPWKRSVVASEIAGLVRAFPAKEGRHVQRGQVLAHLRTESLDIRLDSAIASFKEAKARYRQAKNDLKRIRLLFQKELVTQKESDEAVAEERALRERVVQLQTEIRQVRDLQNKSHITAPFDGWIIEERTEVGQWVEAGGPIVEMVDLTHVQVEVPLPERFVPYVQTDDPVSAVFDGLPHVTIEGNVFSVVAQADRNSRTFPVKIKLPNQDLAIKSGMVARTTLQVGKLHEGIVIPKDALVLRGGQEFVFSVSEGQTEQVPIMTLVHLDEKVEIQGNIQEGELVVVEGNERLRSGQQVRILPEPEAHNISQNP